MQSREWSVRTLDQTRTPYATKLVERGDFLHTRGQAPGHGGKCSTPDFEHIFGANYPKYDMSVVRGLDTSERPGVPTPLQEAEALYADLFGAKLARFVTTGATHASQAAASMLYEMVGRGGQIAVQASVHISVIDALQALGAKVVMLSPGISSLGFATALDHRYLRRVLSKHPQIRAVVVSTPSYEGVVARMDLLAQVCREFGVLSMFDCSWGPEIGVSPRLPMSAIQAGADVVVVSPHKVLVDVPGQAACVLLPYGSGIDDVTFGAEVRKKLSTSKFSPGLAGLDIGRRELALHGEEWIASLFATFKKQEGLLRKIKIKDHSLAKMVVDWEQEKVPFHIPYRPVFRTDWTGVTGYEVADRLMAKGFQVAQPNISFVCCGFGLDSDVAVERMFEGFVEVIGELEFGEPLAGMPVPPLRERVVDFQDVAGSGYELVPLREALGRRSKFPLGGYPPGFCVLLSGAVITMEDILYLEAIFSRGAAAFGPPGEVPPGYIAVMPR